MLNRGIYLPPSAFESWFLNNALTKEDIDYTIAAAKDSLMGIN
jgi:glutamate-1-semialdehyde 2,1-aminomutase